MARREARLPSIRWQFTLRGLFALMTYVALVCAGVATINRPLRPAEVLEIRVSGTLRDNPIDGRYLIESDGAVDLSPCYGRIDVDGLSLADAHAVLEARLRQLLRNPQIEEFSRAGGATTKPLEGRTKGVANKQWLGRS